MLRRRTLSESDPNWDDLLVEFEEGEVAYVFLYRERQWQRWPV